MNTPTVDNDGGQQDEVQPRPIDDDTPQGINPGTAPQGTVDTPAEPKDDDVAPTRPRDETIDSINDKIDAQRKQEQIDFMVETGQLTEEEAAAKLDVAEVVSTGAVVEPMHPDEPTEVAVVAETVDDLDEFIVQDEETGELFFRVKVDGVERLLTADKAKAHLQKHEAADSRLQASSEQLKDLRDLEERLRTGESALRTRLEGIQHRSPSPPAGSDVDDQGLEAETREVVNGLFSGTEAEAAKKLAALLRKYRGNSSPQVDVATIVARATTAAREQVTTENRRAEEATAYSSFETEYADIIADPKLFAMADGMTDGIQKEKPTWTPAQIMTEAGKRTRKLTATDSKAPPVPNDRQVLKRKLRPMPNLRSSEVVPKTPEEVPETPASILADTRKFRGQPS